MANSRNSHKRRDAIRTLTGGGYHFRRPPGEYSTEYLVTKASAMRRGKIRRHIVRRAPRGHRRIARVGKGKIRLEQRGFADLRWHAQERASFAAIRAYCASIMNADRHGFYMRLERNESHPEYPAEAWRTVSPIYQLDRLHRIYKTATSLPTKPFGDIIRYGLHWKIR